jgi:biopolymer transport protein ExbD
MESGGGLCHATQMKITSLLVIAVGGSALVGCSSPEAAVCKPARAWHKVDAKVGVTAPDVTISVRKDNSILWNNAQITSDQLSSYLKPVAAMDAKPKVSLRVEKGISCPSLESVRDEIERSFGCNSAKGNCSEATG